MNFKFMQSILDALNKSKHGMTIQNLMNETKLARGTIKLHLDILEYTSQVEEIRYLQNVKVYFALVKKVKPKPKKIK